MYIPRYITELEQVDILSDKERQELNFVTKRFQFRSNDYYLSLINRNDPEDPIRRIIIPSPEELTGWGRSDPCDEYSYTKMRGLQRKYGDTALLLVTEMCGGFCRFCFRKRIFDKDNKETNLDLTEALAYIRERAEITNILVTGGDPLMLPTSELEPIIRKLREIDHVKIIRIGTKMPAYNPFRILNDPSLPEMIARYSAPQRKIYMMVHFSHPRELTGAAIKTIHAFIKAGAVVCNQAPILKGVNDNPEVLARLFNKLAAAGATPYYLFIVRPTTGNKPFAVPVETAYEIFQRAGAALSGTAKRARLVMSHATGKIEVVARLDDKILFRYHRAADADRAGELIICKSNPDAYWFDDYDEIIDQNSPENAFYCPASE